LLKQFVYDTFPHREKAYYDDPDRHLNAWDAGFWQQYLLAQDLKLSVVDDYKDAFEMLRAKAERRVREWGLL
ncbi:MAG: hypothetical protein LBC29_04385, partial [Propionibacteriaceae bacterium]|nr:hypothetical protein [Propionibacteriaceae bacterium]